jgi:hypothetical protein
MLFLRFEGIGAHLVPIFFAIRCQPQFLVAVGEEYRAVCATGSRIAHLDLRPAFGEAGFFFEREKSRAAPGNAAAAGT